jgi:hypothetical protein
VAVQVGADEIVEWNRSSIVNAICDSGEVVIVISTDNDPHNRGGAQTRV